MNNKKIEKILNDLGINPYLLGYDYLIEAIKIREETFLPICKIYEMIAEKHNVKKCTIDRNIKYCYSGNMDIIKKYFDINYTVNNKKLLALILKKLKEDINE